MDQGVGFGYHYTDPEYGYYEELGALRKEATVFQAEIMALRKAAERMIQVSTRDQKNHRVYGQPSGLDGHEQQDDLVQAGP